MQLIGDIMVVVSSVMLLISFGWWTFSEFKYQFSINKIDRLNSRDIEILKISLQELSDKVAKLEHEIHECALKNNELISQNQQLIDIIKKTQG